MTDHDASCLRRCDPAADQSLVEEVFRRGEAQMAGLQASAAPVMPLPSSTSWAIAAALTVSAAFALTALKRARVEERPVAPVVSLVEQPAAEPEPEAARPVEIPSATPPPARQRRRSQVQPQPVAAPEPQPTAVDEPEPAAAQPSIGEQVALLRRAIEQLRVADDAEASVESTLEYERRFPQGLFIHEARLTRIEGLLRLKKNAELLELFERLSPAELDGLARADELRALHRDLRRKVLEPR